MKKLIVNIILFFVAMILLCTVGVYGLAYALVISIFKYNPLGFLEYWTKLIYSINMGIDQIGNVLLSAFLNRYAIEKLDKPFGKQNETISKVLAVNYFSSNLRKLGKLIVYILETIDTDHMTKSLK